MVSITHALRRIKDDLVTLLSPSFIQQICREQGHAWRDRQLDPVTLIHLFILQILNGNVACACVPRMAGREFTASAYCQARKRLPLRVITALVTRIGAALQETTRTDPGAPGWRGHRVVLVDGSSISMPDTPALQKHFGQPGVQKKGCGFPRTHLLVAFDAHSGLILEVVASPLRTHDMADVHKIHPMLRKGDVLVGDRGYCSYAHLTLLKQYGLEACIRMHQKQIVDFRSRRPHQTGKKTKKGQPTSRWVKKLGIEDQIVEWIRPASPPCWMKRTEFEKLPESLPVRELRYRVQRAGLRTRQVTLVTTLCDEQKYPAQALAELYGLRWQVETNLRHLKSTLRMDILRCESVDGVHKEIWMFALVYNLVRMVMLEAARRQEVQPDRISFADALHWLMYAPPGQALPELIVNPHRPDRIEPRAVKRRQKPHDLLNKPRNEMREALRKRRQAA
jgi:hypothetical protein